MSVLELLYETETEPYQWVELGSQARLRCGYSATKQQPRDFDPGFFNSDSTLILGSREGNSAAEWEFHIDSSNLNKTKHGYLIVACERIHGGLHTREPGKTARIRLNSTQKDYIRLKSVADQYTDYFHRPPTPDFPKLWPVSSCATIYAWPLNKQDFVPSRTQTVEVELEKHATWDIDYVAILVNQSQKKLREGVKEVLFLVLGAILGAVATLLLGA